MEKNETDVELEKEISFHRFGLIFKRAGTVLMFLIMLAGVSGVFGYAWWTKKTAGDKNISIEFERFLRVRKETPMKVTLTGWQDATGNELQILVSNAYFNKVDLMRVEPTPQRILITGKYRAFCYPVAPGPYTCTVEFFTRASQWGKTLLSVGFNNNIYSFNQFIYP